MGFMQEHSSQQGGIDVEGFAYVIEGKPAVICHSVRFFYPLDGFVVGPPLFAVVLWLTALNGSDRIFQHGEQEPALTLE